MHAFARFAAAGIVLTLLAGCSGPDLLAQRAADDDLKCAGYGITPADPGYVQCRDVFARQRAQQQQNAMNALMLHGAYLPQQAPYIQDAQGPVALAPPTMRSCWPDPAGWTCYSQNQ